MELLRDDVFVSKKQLPWYSSDARPIDGLSIEAHRLWFDPGAAGQGIIADII
jgi:hypothetical protein